MLHQLNLKKIEEKSYWKELEEKLTESFPELDIEALYQHLQCLKDLVQKYRNSLQTYLDPLDLTTHKDFLCQQNRKLIEALQLLEEKLVAVIFDLFRCNKGEASMPLPSPRAWDIGDRQVEALVTQRSPRRSPQPSIVSPRPKSARMLSISQGGDRASVLAGGSPDLFSKKKEMPIRFFRIMFKTTKFVLSLEDTLFQCAQELPEAGRESEKTVITFLDALGDCRREFVAFLTELQKDFSNRFAFYSILKQGDVVFRSLHGELERSFGSHSFFTQAFVGFHQVVDELVAQVLVQRRQKLSHQKKAALAELDSRYKNSRDSRETEMLGHEQAAIRAQYENGLGELCRSLAIEANHLILDGPEMNPGGWPYHHLLRVCDRNIGPVRLSRLRREIINRAHKLEDLAMLQASCYGAEGFAKRDLNTLDDEGLIDSIIQVRMSEDVSRFIKLIFDFDCYGQADPESNFIEFLLDRNQSIGLNEEGRELCRKIEMLDDAGKAQLLSQFRELVMPFRKDFVRAHHMLDIYGNLKYILRTMQFVSNTPPGSLVDSIEGLIDSHHGALTSLNQNLLCFLDFLAKKPHERDDPLERAVRYALVIVHLQESLLERPEPDLEVNLEHEYVRDSDKKMP